MKIGIIIIFHNNQEEININYFLAQLDKVSNIEFCLVNNSSKDNTYQLLKEVKQETRSNVSIVDIKKHVSEQLAIKAGARYLSNHFDIKHIGFLNIETLNTQKNNLKELINTIYDNRDFILKHNIEILKKQSIKQTLFKNIFSVIEYLKKVEACYQL